MKQNIQELEHIQTLHETGKKVEAEKALEKWIQKNPSIGIGYELQCAWELEKKHPDMERIAQILNEADDQNTYVENESIYEQVIQYFEETGNKEMKAYYTALLHFKKIFTEEAWDEDDFEDEDYWDDEDYWEDEDFEEEAFEEEKQELIEEMLKNATDKVKPNKKIEQYLEECTKEELVTIIGPRGAFIPEEELRKIEEHIKEYLLQNYDETIQENLVYLPQIVIQTIKETPSTGYLKQNLEESTLQELVELHPYFLMKGLGMAFIGKNKEELIIHIPHIQELKACVKDKRILRENAEFNEKAKCLAGICEVHGAIKTKQLKHIMDAFYGEQDNQTFAKILLLIHMLFGNIQIKIDRRTNNLQYIYHYAIAEKDAKELLKPVKELKTYSKDEYLKYGEEHFLKNTKGYKKIEEEFEIISGGQEIADDMVYEIIDGMIIPYCVEKRLGTFKAEQLLEDIQNILIEIQEEAQIEDFYIDPKKIRRAIREIAEELPKWK